MIKEKLLVDGKFLMQPLTGVQRFASELSKSLVRLDVDLRIFVPKNYRSNNLDGESMILDNYVVKSKFNSRILLWQQWDLLRYAKLSGRTIVVFSGLGPILAFKRVLFIHDAVIFRYPDNYNRPYILIYRICYSKFFLRFARLYTVSDFSRRELSYFLRLPIERDKVIHNGPKDWSSVTSIEPDYVKQNYILIVSSIDPRKNLNNVVRAISLYKNFDSSVQFLLVGAPNRVFSDSEFTLPTNCVHCGRVSDGVLKYLYENALGLVYCPFYEGFGLPPLEANSFGKNVVLSDIEVFRELYRDFEYFVDPYSIESIFRGIVCMVNSTNRTTPSAVDLNYSWTASARKFISTL